jgi:hypothetical protein
VERTISNLEYDRHYFVLEAPVHSLLGRERLTNGFWLLTGRHAP